MVKAKMRCEMKKEMQDGGFDVLLRPVSGGSPENEKYYKYTPSGDCSLGILNKAAADQFEEGKEYYVTFEPA